MILTEYVTHYGKRVLVEKLSDSSGHEVLVQCPQCKNKRLAQYRTVRKAGHYLCLPCVSHNGREILEVGATFSMFTVLGECEVGSSLCLCECGEKKSVDNWSLKNKRVKSCGCLRRRNFENSKKVGGSEHGMWKGGVSTSRERDMQTSQYKNWRKSVFERDRYFCQRCMQKGENLNAHHIYPYSTHPHLRVDTDNGVTLCCFCHADFHSLYGRKENNMAQLLEFIN